MLWPRVLLEGQVPLLDRGVFVVDGKRVVEARGAACRCRQRC